MEPEKSIRKKLLVIEDDPSVLASLTLCLQASYDIVSASTVRSGIKTFKKARPSLVLLDLRLPDGDGLNALREIRRNGAATPVVILTGYASMGSVEEALRLGASDYLHKPFSVSTLRQRVAELLAAASQKKAAGAGGKWNDLAGDEFSFPEDVGLSRREIEVLRWIGRGKRDSEIAVILSISVRTVNHHVASILKKLRVETRTAAAALISGGDS